MEAFVGGEPALVVFGGTEYGMFCGIQRVDVLIPVDSPTGAAVPIALSHPLTNGDAPLAPVTWYRTQSGVTIAIE
jgi:hypothetical protein